MSLVEDRHLGVAEMDATHDEFVALVAAATAASDAEFPGLFGQLQAHTRLHFENERRLMRASRFPAMGEHESEHLRVLGEMAHFSRGVAAGRYGLARAYVKALPEWFAAHLATMDAALAACVKRVFAAEPALAGGGRSRRPSPVV